MTGLQIEIIMIALLAAVTCAIPGVFLVLRRMSMISDAISHAILPGIAIGFLITHSVNSPLLIILAALMGVVTIALTEMVSSTRLVREDAAIGLVFPALFSIGVVLITNKAGYIHIDTDTVLLGEIAFAPFNRLTISGFDLGPMSLWVMGLILLLNLTFIKIFFKELKLSTFDASLAASFGFLPGVLNYALMSIVSVTIVGAFDAVGVILVIALMIAPAATAYMLTDNLKTMIALSVVFGMIAAVSGYWIARFLDASIAGVMASMCGILFLIAYFFAPDRGLFATMKRKIRQQTEFAQMTLAIHIFNHSGAHENIEERMESQLIHHLGWDQKFIQKILRLSTNAGIISADKGILSLTEKGQRFVKAANMLISSKYHPSFSTLRKEFIIFTDS
jgi:manganese/zinc/iron transport system permease protein